MNRLARSRGLCRALCLLVGLCPVWATAQQAYRITELGTLDGAVVQGSAMNASGQVTGSADETSERATLWDGSTLHDLGALGGTSSYGGAINDSGHVTGYAKNKNDSNRAFLWDGSWMRDLGTLGSAPGGSRS